MTAGMKRTLIPLPYADLTAWRYPDTSALSANMRMQYQSRRQAVEMYAAGEPFTKISQITGKSDDETRRLVTRCLTLGADGKIVGFYALIPGARLKDYERQTLVKHAKGSGSGGCAGALEQVFERYPDIRQLVHDIFLKGGSGNDIREARAPLYSVHESFKKALRERGFTDFDWPFSTSNCGYKAICGYCKKLREEIGARGMLARSGVDAARRSTVGNGHHSLIPNLRGYSFVQLDFHKIDAASIIVIRNDYGGELEVPISRWHIGFLVEERFGPIIGAHVALELTPSGDSTLETVESALIPEDFSPDDPRAKLLEDNKSLIIQLIPELQYQCFSALKVDNGWANAAHEVVNNIMDTVGCAVNFGPTYAWWRRALIEMIFGELTRAGLQRLQSTHGARPGDSRVSDPNGQAIKFRIMLSDLISIIYGCIRAHNVEKTERLQWTSPLDGIKAALENSASGLFRQPLPVPVQANPRLLMHIEEVTVRGNLKKNIRPYFILDRCRHTNPTLADAYWLIGKKLITYTDRRLCRIVFAVVKDTGEQLGQMFPPKRWAESNCSWRDRKLINRSGLADSHSSDSADPYKQWAHIKGKEIVQQRAKRKNQKKSSSDALKLAKLVKQDKSAGRSMPSSSGPIQRPTAASRPSVADPFGLNDVPTMKPMPRRP